MAASQNSRSGSTSKTHRRSRPAIQTDPDLTIQTDPDLTVQTYDPDPFVLCWLDIFFYKVLKSITLYYKVLLQYYSVLQSTRKHYSVRNLLLQYYSVLQSTILGDLVNFGNIWPSRSRPRSRPFQTRSRPVSWNPRAVAQEEKQVRPAQNHLIQFKSYMK